jgi:hypothetical protein
VAEVASAPEGGGCGSNYHPFSREEQSVTSIERKHRAVEFMFGSNVGDVDELSTDVETNLIDGALLKPLQVLKCDSNPGVEIGRCLNKGN